MTRRPVWLLDLDNTLHDALTHIMPRIDRAMTDYVMTHLSVNEVQANLLRLQYWQRYGATLLGMVRHHGVDATHFLRETHPFPDLPLLVRKDLRLLHLLRRPALDGVLTIEDMQHAGRLMPKPSRPMLRKVLARLRLPAQSCVLVEDTVDNLRAARHCGVRTVWVSGIVRPARPLTQRHRRGHGAVDVHLKSVVELARTALARPTHERQLHA